MYTEDGRKDLLDDDVEKQAGTKLIEMPLNEFFDRCGRQRYERSDTSMTYHYYTARVVEAFPGSMYLSYEQGIAQKLRWKLLLNSAPSPHLITHTYD